MAIDVSGRQSDGGSGMDWLARWAHAAWVPLVPGSRQWVGVFEGHEVRVVTRGILRACLYLDGECRDQRWAILPARRKVPVLSARLPSRQPGVSIVEVYSRALFARRIEVRVAGKRISMILSGNA